MCRTGCNSRCSRCAGAACNKVCEKYVEVPECPKLSRAPYVCNGCRSRITLACRHRCWFYDADTANEEAAWAKVVGRQGVDCSPEELAAMVAVVKPLMRKGQSLSQYLADPRVRVSRRGADVLPLHQSRNPRHLQPRAPQKSEVQAEAEAQEGRGPVQALPGGQDIRRLPETRL